MAVEEQIADTEYFLESVKNSGSHREIRANLAAFLAMCRSIADHLLEDYNTKFGLNIDLKEKLTYDRFEREAKNPLNQNALDFIHFFRKEFQDLKKKDRTFEQLYNKRNIKVHRIDIPVRGEFSRSVSEKEKVSASLNVTVTRKNRKVEQLTNDSHQKRQGDNKSQSDKSETLQEGNPTDSVKWYFTDYDEKDVLKLCQEFLDKMKTFVKKIHDNFP